MSILGFAVLAVVLISEKTNGFLMMDGIIRPAIISYSLVEDEEKVKIERRENGRFGESYIGSFYGNLQHINGTEQDDTGCELPWFEDRPPAKPWVALVRKGACPYQKQIELAAQHEASGIIIYDDKNSTHLPKVNIIKKNEGETQSSNWSKLFLRTSPQDENEWLEKEEGEMKDTIKAVFTYRWKGEELINLMKNGSKIKVYVSAGKWRVDDTERFEKLKTIFRLCLLYFQKADPLKPVKGAPADSSRGLLNASTLISYDTQRNRSLLCICISFIVLMGATLIGVVVYYVKRSRLMQSKDNLSRRMMSAAHTALSKIPTKRIKPEDLENSQDDIDDCVICFDSFKIHEMIRILPCRHEYHKSCIDPWLLEHRTCPMCKMDILRFYGFVFTGSIECILQIEADDINSESDHETMDSPMAYVRAAHLEMVPELPENESPEIIEVDIPISPSLDEDDNEVDTGEQSEETTSTSPFSTSASPEVISNTTESILTKQADNEQTE
ncbi:protein goliath-like isoform X2 [Cimex lectularius]|uniref:RING-type domain-containing protein n=1 Tax=Cimex lectularius TaxID=79782 RepID=A0A8I6S440_CIMLE|nr:protein goliath-like isoform X2 [Cimex lectularius]